MQVVFRCPVQGTQVQSHAALRKGDSTSSKVTASVKRSIGWSIKSALARTVRQALGYGIAGSLAGDAVYSASSGAGGTTKFNDSEKQQAIVDAFNSVRSSFAWDSAGNRFISAEAAGATQAELTKQLNLAPVSVGYDRSVLARMLTEIAAADGNLGPEEASFFSYFITPEMGTLESLAQSPALSAAELSECSQGPVRETMLMLAWALALSDQDVDPSEVARLTSLAEGLAIETARADELKSYAQAYQIDSSLGPVYASGQRDPQAYQQVIALGEKIGIGTDVIERVDIRYRKRHGLV